MRTIVTIGLVKLSYILVFWFDTFDLEHGGHFNAAENCYILSRITCFTVEDGQNLEPSAAQPVEA